MARSPLLRWLQRLAAATRDETCGSPSPAALASRRARIESRRAFIAKMAALGAWSAAPALGAPPRFALAREPRIVIVGAGLAGLAAAYELSKAGVAASLVEGAPRLGGRCLTERNAFADGQIAERGGELVDTAHDALIDLAIELGLPLDDLAATEPAGTEAVYRFGGERYDTAAATRDLRALWRRLAHDARIVGDDYPTFYRHTRAQRELDRLSCAQWIETRVAGGMRSRFGQLLANAYTEELGADPDEISAISVVELLAGSPQERFSPYEESDQRYHVRGGNDQLVHRLAERLGDTARTSTRLVALVRTAEGRVRLTLQRDAALRDEIADSVVLAIPFTMLRGVDLSRAGFGARKLACIRELGMGRNTKLQLQFAGRTWLRAGCNGETRVHGSYQVTWDVTRAQPGRSGILNFFSGGSTAVAAGEGSPEERAREALADLGSVLPDLPAQWTGRVIRNAWDRYPWSGGSYALLKPGQYTTIHGVEDTREGPVHFAGEQSSLLYAGYMNGAIESGQRAAREALAALAPSARRAAGAVRR